MIIAVLRARGGSMTAGQIAERFRQAWPTTTRHLGVLEQAGVIAVEKRGRERHYELRPEALRGGATWILDAARPAAASAGDAWTALPYAHMRNATRPGP